MQYSVILCDPPWRFRVWNRDTGMGRSAESHYPTMTTEDLARLPVSDLALPDSVLLLWATAPMLPEAFALGAAWGFTYKTVGLTWAKTTRRGLGFHMGMGYWTRANCEFCLLFAKGSPKRKARDVRQLLIAPLGQHSEKPWEQYGRIERLLDGPYIELFARKARRGWVSLGNELDGRDIAQAITDEASDANCLTADA